MVLAEKKLLQLQHLHKVITEEKYWTKDRFRVMNNEAGSGKSIQTFDSIAELAITTEYKIVYVQMFANESSEKQDAKELKDTVSKINKNAGDRVASYMCAENRKKHKQILKDSQVICITHKKYLELCKKGGSNFITEADILIIDEFPNLFESFYISELELTKLQGFTLLSEKDKEDIEDLNNFVLHKLNLFKDKFGKDMRIINLHKLDVVKYKKVLDTVIKNAKKDNKVAHKNTIAIANKVLEIFNHSSVYSSVKVGNKNYSAVYSFYQTNYILAKSNNIILDANGSFDRRYKLRKDLFQLDYQAKVFDYSDSTINIYPIATTKTALASYKGIIADVIEYIKNKKLCTKGGFEKVHRRNLIITDITREEDISEKTKEVLEVFSNISLAHFGALIGKNDWKNFNNIWILKTPFYSWVEYILQYLFYSQEELNGNTNCEIKVKKGEYNNYTIFRNKDFNKFKNSIVLGEYYQACKRIARDGRQCTFNILTAEEDIFELLKQQFRNINEEVKEDLLIELIEKKETKKTGRKPTKTMERIEMIKDYLKKAKKQGKNKIEKVELVDLLGIQKTKLSPLLKKIDNIEIGKGKEQEYIRLP